MNVHRSLRMSLALVAVWGWAAACGTLTSAGGTPAAVNENVGEATPRTNVWIAFAPGGGSSTTMPQADGTAIVTGGGLRPPIFSVRLDSREREHSLEAELAMPVGFDLRHIGAADIRDEDRPSDAYSRAAFDEERLERALMHHRPVARLHIGADGKARLQSSAALRRHEGCAARRLRAAIETRIAAAQNDAQRGSQAKRLQEDFLAGISPPVDHASLLLLLANLSLPSSTVPIPLAEPLSGQERWRAGQIRAHGRPVSLRLDLSFAGRAPAAGLCRSLEYKQISRPRSDTCTIKGVIDRRDGWPLTMSITRDGKSARGDESVYRSFLRLSPLEGFGPPSNPCARR